NTPSGRRPVAGRFISWKPAWSTPKATKSAPANKAKSCIDRRNYVRAIGTNRKKQRPHSVMAGFIPVIWSRVTRPVTSRWSTASRMSSTPAASWSPRAKSRMPSIRTRPWLKLPSSAPRMTNGSRPSPHSWCCDPAARSVRTNSPPMYVISWPPSRYPDASKSSRHCHATKAANCLNASSGKRLERPTIPAAAGRGLGRDHRPQRLHQHVHGHYEQHAGKYDVKRAAGSGQMARSQSTAPATGHAANNEQPGQWPVDEPGAGVIKRCRQAEAADSEQGRANRLDDLHARRQHQARHDHEAAADAEESRDRAGAQASTQQARIEIADGIIVKLCNW